MPKILATWICLLVLMPFSGLSAEARQPVIAVIGEPGLRDQSALMTAVLAGQNAVSMVEREEVNKILEEQKWTAAGLTRGHAMKLGELLGADGLLLLRCYPPSTDVSLRLVSVKHGIVLCNQTYDAKAYTEDGIHNLILPMLQPLWPKLRVALNAAIPISFGGLHATALGTDMRNLELELSTLLEKRLIREPSLFVLERKHMEMLMAEKQWSGQNESPLTGNILLEGSIEKSGDKLQLQAVIQPPDGGKNLEIKVEGTQNQKLALINKLALDILANLQTTPQTEPWDPLGEAKAYQKIATWALDHQLLSEARSAAEASWALGEHGNELNETRMKAWCMGAYPGWGTYRTGPTLNTYSFYAVDVRKEPQRLEAAIRAVEILTDYLQTQPRTEQDYSASDDEGKTNYDYRILSARVLLIASRLLRCFYEDDACTGHEDRLLYLRELMRLAFDNLIQDEQKIDDRQLWIHRIRSAYAAYLYEKPEESVKVYQSLLDRNLEAWILHRDPANNILGICTDKNDGCVLHRLPKNRYHTPFVISWQPEHTDHAKQVWSDYLNKLQSSDKPDEQAAAWVFIGLNKLPEEQADPLREFVWQHREQMTDTRKCHFIWNQLGKIYNNTKPSREECIRFYQYLMRDGTMVDTLFAHNLLDMIDATGADAAQYKADLDQYLARARKNLPKEIANKHIPDARHWIGMSLDKEYQEWKQNGYSQPVKTEPPIQLPPAPAGAIPVTRNWSSWTHLPADLLGNELAGHCEADGKIWCFTKSGNSKVFGIDIQSFALTTIDIPVRKYGHVDSLTAGKGRLFATWDNTVHEYDFTSQTWISIPVPPNFYTLQYIDPYCYLLFGSINKSGPSSVGDPDVASGVYRYAPRSKKLKLLTSTRRRPAHCDLDSLQPYRPLAITSSRNGYLYLDITSDRYGKHHSFFTANPDGENWKQSFSVDTGSLPVVRADLGGLLCESGIRGYSFFPDIGNPDHLHPLLAMPPTATSNSTDSSSVWKPPMLVVKNRKSRGITAATTVSNDLWLISMQEAIIQDWYFLIHPVLHHYTHGQEIPQDIHLDFQIPEKEQTKIRELAYASSNFAQVAESTRQTVIPRMLGITDVIPVKDGFVFPTLYGFWHLPHADIERNTPTSKK